MNGAATNGSNGSNGSNGTRQPIDIAIIGGGIVGLILALGLVKRNYNVTIYEQAGSFRELGAGIAFTSNAIKAMRILDPRIVDTLNRIATPNGDPENPTDYLKFVDGYNSESNNPKDMNEKFLFQLYTGYRGFSGAHRGHFIQEIVKLMPEGHVIFSKRLLKFEDKDDNSKVVLKFADGTTAEADAVIGCDGIKSRVRQLLLGEDSPASYPHYSHKYAFRALIPMEKAVEVLGHYKCHNQHMHMGPGQHMLTFPVADYKLMNMVAFVTDPNDWSAQGKMTAPATKEEVVKAFADWCPAVRAITNLLPDTLDKWGIFDTHDYPAPTYAQGRVCLAGDAAHASSPHHGGGAGIGVEDALTLVSLMERVITTLQTTSLSKGKAIRAAFAAYDPVRRERTQWFVASSRHACDIYEWQAPECGSDLDKCYREIRWRSHRLWHFDLDYMMGEAGENYKRILGSA
ncbi:hypothetical protein F5884DRAFT_868939 [Xylogone sp. PMI_703]|nr:hypothetical protein F5884DRAFT_868939 [Xylogone sp. PMI_703]